jgi:hypothetical protein
VQLVKRLVAVGDVIVEPWVLRGFAFYALERFEGAVG